MPKWRRIAGWVLSGLLGALFVGGATYALTRPPAVIEQFGKFGLKDQVLLIAVGELVSGILFLIPITHPLGVLLLSGYMGGAIMAHMSHGESYLFQSVILVLIWVAGFLRRPWLLVDPPASPQPGDLPTS